MTTNTLITKERVKDWNACTDGFKWFLDNYKPAEAEFVPVYQHLIRDERNGDADWLLGKLLEELDTETHVKLVVQIAGADAKVIAEQQAAGAPGVTTGDDANAATTGDYANAATTGYYANAATTGDYANAATTGNYANAATTGYRANAATTGYRANAATTGDYANAATTGYRANAATTGECANAATTGDYANAATTGECANAATTGECAVAASLGIHAKAKASATGGIVLAWRDQRGKLLGIRASMVGENNIQPDVWYTLNDAGEFVESEE